MRCEVLGRTDRGLRRHHNEDAVLARADLGLVVVADGMGGHAAGEVAAHLAVRELEEFILSTREIMERTWPDGWDTSASPSANRLARGIEAAHARVTAAVESDDELKGMGATIVAALLEPETPLLTVAHVGDSRAYLFRDGALRLLTSDHSWVHEQVVAGLLSEEVARTHPLKNVVTRALGGTQTPVVDIVEEPVCAGDLLLLCSDGLNTMLADEDIATIMGREPALDRVAAHLIDEANRRGGVDNISVAMLRITE